jgi:hypothetical protein
LAGAAFFAAACGAAFFAAAPPLAVFEAVLEGAFFAGAAVFAGAVLAAPIFFAGVPYDADFLAEAYFAVAITFSLLKWKRNRGPTGRDRGYSSPGGCPGGASPVR